MHRTDVGTILSSFISDSGKVLVFNIETGQPYVDSRPIKLTYQCVIEHSNMAAVRIGHEKLAQLVRACGLTHIMDSNELNGSKLFVTWEPEHADERRRSEVTRVAPLPRPVPDAVEAPSPHEPSRAWRWASIAAACVWADFVRKPISALLGIVLLACGLIALWHWEPPIAIIYFALSHIIFEQRGPLVREDEEDEDYD